MASKGLASRTPVTDTIRDNMWGLDRTSRVGPGHRTGWGDLWALSTGDGPALRPTAGGRYIDLAPVARRSTSDRWRYGTRPALSTLYTGSLGSATAAPPASARSVAAADRSRHATQMLRRGLTDAAAEAYASAIEVDPMTHIAAPEERIGRWDGVPPR